MISYVDACETLYFSEYNSERLLKQLQESFDCSISSIERYLVTPIHKILNQEPCLYWNKDTAHQVLDTLEKCSVATNKLIIEECTFEHFIIAYGTYVQLSDTWLDIHDFNISDATKTRLYRLPMYTSIVEGCLSNLLRFLAIPLSLLSQKDYTAQNKLRPLIDVAKSNGLNEITDHVDVNLRNAINHGGVAIQRTGGGTDILFHYTENNQSKAKSIRLYEFDKILDEAYDMVSGLIMGILLFLNRHMELLSIDRTKKGYVPFALLSMELSTPRNICTFISDLPNEKQINVEMSITNYNKGHIFQLALMIAILVHNRYSYYEKYYISLSHPRMLTGWLRFTQEQLADIVQNRRLPQEVVQEVLSKDALVFDASEEDVDINEAKYFCFPNFSSEGMRINKIADASQSDRKRLRAHLYVGQVDSREEILAKIEKAIDWLKTIKNPPCPEFQHKHGSMPADALYINVYKFDERKNKELLPKNDNFICFVDYNQSGETTLENGGLPQIIWKQLFHETINTMQIAWREKKYLTKHVVKIGRNDLCPCGSGKKYKKCCGSL